MGFRQITRVNKRSFINQVMRIFNGYREYYNMKDLNVDKHLFWDVDFATMDLEKSSVYIIGRVLNYGTLDDIKGVLVKYGVDRVKRDIVYNTDPTAKTLNFVSKIFDIPLTQFRCYIRRQSSPLPWNY